MIEVSQPASFFTVHSVRILGARKTWSEILEDLWCIFAYTTRPTVKLNCFKSNLPRAATAYLDIGFLKNSSNIYFLAKVFISSWLAIYIFHLIFFTQNENERALKYVFGAVRQWPVVQTTNMYTKNTWKAYPDGKAFLTHPEERERERERESFVIDFKHFDVSEIQWKFWILPKG